LSNPKRRPLKSNSTQNGSSVPGAGEKTSGTYHEAWGELTRGSNQRESRSKDRRLRCLKKLDAKEGPEDNRKPNIQVGPGE